MSCDSGRVLTFSINLLHYFFVVFDIVESYAPGFIDSVIVRDILTSPDLENKVCATRNRSDLSPLTNVKTDTD
jgi:hypothetical protein